MDCVKQDYFYFLRSLGEYSGQDLEYASEHLRKEEHLVSQQLEHKLNAIKIVVYDLSVYRKIMDPPGLETNKKEALCGKVIAYVNQTHIPTWSEYQKLKGNSFAHLPITLQKGIREHTSLMVQRMMRDFVLEQAVSKECCWELKSDQSSTEKNSPMQIANVLREVYSPPLKALLDKYKGCLQLYLIKRIARPLEIYARQRAASYLKLSRIPQHLWISIVNQAVYRFAKVYVDEIREFDGLRRLGKIVCGSEDKLTGITQLMGDKLDHLFPLGKTSRGQLSQSEMDFLKNCGL